MTTEEAKYVFALAIEQSLIDLDEALGLLLDALTNEQVQELIDNSGVDTSKIVMAHYDAGDEFEYEEEAEEDEEEF